MRFHVRFLPVLAIVAPLIGHVGDDSSSVRFAAEGGTGSYASISRGCSGEIGTSARKDFQSYGMAVEARTSSHTTLSLRAGTVSLADGSKRTAYVGPAASLRTGPIDLGAGVLFGSRFPYSDRYGDPELPQPSFHIAARLKEQKDIYLSLSFLEGTALLAGNQEIAIGLGMRPADRLDAWLGVGAGYPYDGGGTLARVRYRLDHGIALTGNMRLGGKQDIAEDSFSFGVQFSPP